MTLGLSMLTAGVSTRANLISYWNTNFGILNNAVIATGVSGGQTIYGGTGANNNLVFYTTSNATKGKFGFGVSPSEKMDCALGTDGVLQLQSGLTGVAGDKAGIRFKHSAAGHYTAIRSITTASTPGYQNPRLGFFTQAADTYLPADLTERMSILASTGYTGFGVTAPEKMIHIHHTSDPVIYLTDGSSSKWWLHGKATGTTQQFGIYDGTATTYRLLINSAGLVTISALYASGNVSALTFTDRTEAFQGSALSDIEKIKTTGKGDLDHATLPEFAVMPYQDESGEWWPGRSLGAMISILVKATQERSAQYAAAIADRDAKIEKLESRIAALEKTIAAPAKKE